MPGTSPQTGLRIPALSIPTMPTNHDYYESLSKNSPSYIRPSTRGVQATVRYLVIIISTHVGHELLYWTWIVFGTAIELKTQYSKSSTSEDICNLS